MTAPMAYYYIPGTMQMTWDPSKFIPAKQWLGQQGSAVEAEVEARRPEKGHAADQPQPQEQQLEKGHAADHLEGERATQASENRHKTFGAHRAPHNIGPSSKIGP